MKSEHELFVHYEYILWGTWSCERRLRALYNFNHLCQAWFYKLIIDQSGYVNLGLRIRELLEERLWHPIAV